MNIKHIWSLWNIEPQQQSLIVRSSGQFSWVISRSGFTPSSPHYTVLDSFLELYQGQVSPRHLLITQFWTVFLSYIKVRFHPSSPHYTVLDSFIELYQGQVSPCHLLITQFWTVFLSYIKVRLHPVISSLHSSGQFSWVISRSGFTPSSPHYTVLDSFLELYQGQVSPRHLLITQYRCQVFSGLKPVFLSFF